MIRCTLLLLLFLTSLGSHAQSDSISGSVILGFSAGLPIYQDIAAQKYGVELYSRSRNNVTNLKAGVHIDLNEKNKLEILYQRTRFKMDENKLESLYSKRMPNHFVYSDFDIDNTNSTGNQFVLNSLEIHYGRLFHVGKVNLYPSIGLGAGIWNHRDYYYVLRSKADNNYTEYRFHLKKRIQPTYTVSLRTGIKRFPHTFIEIALRGGPNNYKYSAEVIPQNSPEASTLEDINYKRFIQTGQIGLVVYISE